MPTLAIETIDLRRSYGATVAVDGLNIRVESGEFFGLLGPNGAGKTTTIKMLCCILKPTAGTARILGKDIITESLEVKQLIGYVPENPSPYEFLTVDEFLTFMGGIRNVEKGELGDRIDRYLETFQLTERRGSLIGSLSLGMRQKVAITAALLHEPKVLLLDEPFMGIDPISQRMVKKLLLERLRGGATIVFSTHIMDWAEAMCRKIGIINNGRLIAEGTMKDLRSMSKSGEHATLDEVFLKLTEEAREVSVE